MQSHQNILIIITGSIAAYKGLECIRALRERGCNVTTVLTEGGQQFITPLSAGALSGSPVYTDLFSLKDETEMGHIRLAREADAILVAPASADFLSRMAHGYAADLASAIILASDSPVYVAPAMNPQMWQHPATQRNMALLREDGVQIIGPMKGDTACGEQGFGRMSEPESIIDTILKNDQNALSTDGPLAGFSALVTSGPTYEAIDPVRFLGNRSSGKQGYAIAAALLDAGAEVTLVSGPCTEPPPTGAHYIPVESAEEMKHACEASLPVDIAVCAAAVSDWCPVTPADQKLKKNHGETPPTMALRETPDILLSLGYHKEKRPALVIGFAAETENVEENARAKRVKKGCDWIIANDVSGDRVFGKDTNEVLFVSEEGSELWPADQKRGVASKLVDIIVHYFNDKYDTKKAV